MTIRSGLILGLSLCLASVPTQARTHLNHQELKALSMSSVAVVYVGTDTSLEHGLDPDHHMFGVTPVTVMLADVVNSYRLHMLLAHISPYQAALDRLALPASTHKDVQDALVSIPWLQKNPWTDVRVGQNDRRFLTEQTARAKAPVVIFIQPRLFLAPAAGTLYLVCSIDIETAAADGSGISHYDSSEVIASQGMDPADQPAPRKDQDAAELRLAKLFANDGEGFKQLYAKLMLRSQQQLYYYFTGNSASPPPAAARTGQ